MRSRAPARGASLTGSSAKTSLAPILPARAQRSCGARRRAGRHSSSGPKARRARTPRQARRRGRSSGSGCRRAPHRASPSVPVRSPARPGEGVVVVPLASPTVSPADAAVDGSSDRYPVRSSDRSQRDLRTHSQSGLQIRSQKTGGSSRDRRHGPRTQVRRSGARRRAQRGIVDCEIARRHRRFCGLATFWLRTAPPSSGRHARCRRRGPGAPA